jgi:hypothetical protein
MLLRTQASWHATLLRCRIAAEIPASAAQDRSLAVVSAFACAVVAQKPPSTSEIDALIPKFLALDHTTAQGHAEANDLLARLAALPPLEANQLAEWNAKIHKAWSSVTLGAGRSGRSGTAA